MRVGTDVTPYWSNYVDRIIGQGFEQLSTKNCIRNTLTRSFMHDKFFQNDPDCLITRQKQNRLSDSEMRTLGQVNALSGGPLMISDDLDLLGIKSMNLLNTVYDIYDKLKLIIEDTWRPISWKTKCLKPSLLWVHMMHILESTISHQSLLCEKLSFHGL